MLRLGQFLLNFILGFFAWLVNNLWTLFHALSITLQAFRGGFRLSGDLLLSFIDLLLSFIFLCLCAFLFICFINLWQWDIILLFATQVFSGLIGFGGCALQQRA